MIPFDRYTVRTRIQPALYVVLPFGVVLFVWMPGESLPAGALLGLFATGGGTAVLSQLGRDLGRRKQAGLWERWGGPPTTSLLRFRDSLNRSLLQHWRAKLESLRGHALPSEQEEVEDPVGSDQKYEAAVNYLRESTRDTEKFPLVFAENINYGFRRNLWGMKPYGLVIAILAMVCSWVFFFWLAGLPTTVTWSADALAKPDTVVVSRLVGSIANTIVVAVWLLVIRPSWVKTAAEAYAERLLGAVESLAPTPLAKGS